MSCLPLFFGCLVVFQLLCSVGYNLELHNVMGIVLGAEPSFIFPAEYQNHKAVQSNPL